MLKILDYQVYGLEQSVYRSGFPMSISDNIKFDGKISDVDYYRSQKLGQSESGSGHDCFLKGIVVQFDVKFPEYWSPQFQRYHFADIISSQSKMHRIAKFDIKSNCNEYVDSEIIDIVNKYKDLYNQETNQLNKEFYFMKIISNLPMGFEKIMGITTNYLQLKTIYKQRHTHKLQEWIYFCDWILKLPYFVQLTGIDKN